jgi:hypothetical protein
MYECRRREPRSAGTAASLALLIACIFPLTATAIPINLDFGSTYGTPSSSYGGAAGWVGTWNQIDPTSSSPNSVLDINGNPTGVTVTVSPGERLYSSNDPSTSGDVQALLDDELDVWPYTVGGTATVTISGLIAGPYEVYTYARDANTPRNETVTITVNGVSQTVQPTSNTFSGFILGENYAFHSGVLAAGQNLNITATIQNDVGGDYGMINGIQFVPEPKTLLLIATGLAGLAVQGRKRTAGR